MNGRRGTALAARAAIVAWGEPVVLPGLLMVVLLGPGLPALIAGLGPVGREFPRAKRMSDHSRGRLQNVGNRVSVRLGWGANTEAANTLPPGLDGVSR